ncbi:uncharacterized protein VTP21DRAFT_11304 [Calcarisporiella thermophila]|uniref:uncharacterized protein n=1 Tax=Calcarisporiella thermophila TaxID=911321 RepID=UPI003742647F
MLHTEFGQRVLSSSSTIPSFETPFPSTRSLAAASPHAPLKNKYNADRFIPNRCNLSTRFHLLDDNGEPPNTPCPKRTHFSSTSSKFLKDDGAKRTFNDLLRAELFGPDLMLTDLDGYSSGDSKRGSSSTPKKRLFTYNMGSNFHQGSSLDAPVRDSYSLSPIGMHSQRLLLMHSPRGINNRRKNIPKREAYKILDAPELKDDFYLSLLNWSVRNVLAVGLGSAVYLWAKEGEVTKLCDIGEESKAEGGKEDFPTSISWSPNGSYLAVGTNSGTVQLWDAAQSRRVCILPGHIARVGAMTWSDGVLTTGSRDTSILHRDPREHRPYFQKLEHHSQEVCGLSWSPDGRYLASGGNDNLLSIVDGFRTEPLHRLDAHQSAVKALAWHPLQSGLLASGGGTHDQRLRFWSAQSGTLLHEVETGSQICQLAWSPTGRELVSTHGYSQNQIGVWKYPTMEQVALLQGHTSRVLYLAVSPDGRSICTGAGDETLRFWRVFAESSPREEEMDLFWQIR